MNDESEPVGPEVLLELERRAGAPALREQLELRLREQIRAGRLSPGAKMPSSRSLAAALQVSRGVVLEAYGQLSAEGYLTASQGAPTRVAPGPSTEPPPLASGHAAGPLRLRLQPPAPGPRCVSASELGPVDPRRPAGDLVRRARGGRSAGHA